VELQQEAVQGDQGRDQEVRRRHHRRQQGEVQVQVHLHAGLWRQGRQVQAGVNLIKFLAPVIYKCSNKMECLALVLISGFSKFVSKARSST
jgi:hypothetical protein